MNKKLFAVIYILSSIISISNSGQYVPKQNNRKVINLGDTPWKFIKQDISGAQNPSYNDSSWQDVGIPHCYNDMDTFQNIETGIGNPFVGTVWYRKHFNLDSKYSSRKIFILFEGVNIGCAVYINGIFIPGNSLVQQPAGSQVTHVGGNISFIVDITSYVYFGGTDNVLALRVANYGYWWTNIWYTPTIGSDFWCGGAQGGINSPVWLIITDKLHIPMNVYSVLEKWGTYVATPNVNETSAELRMQTNVQNETSQTKNVTLVTEVVDANNNIVLTLISGPQIINPGQTYLFDQTGIITNPHLWYPNNSPYGGPYLYKIYSTVIDSNTPVDVFETPLGIRNITWDKDFPYFNGHKHLLWGAALRQDYPGLGNGVPVEQRWRDMKLLKDCGGNYIRPGHNAAVMAYVDACNHYGITITQPSQDAEGNVGADPSKLESDKQYKREYLRDTIIRDRNNPSIITWEIANGKLPSGFPAELKTIIDTYDPLNRINTTNKRLLADTNSDSSIDWAIAEVAGVMNAADGTKYAHPNTPVYTAELWHTGYGYCGRAFWSESYVEGYAHVTALDKNANCFGATHWTLWEYAGESRESLEGLKLRGGGWSMTDGSRIPKMTYYVYQNALWIPFSIKPGVFIGGHWNRDSIGSTTTVKVWSNCPAVELFINGKSQGIKTPNSWTTFPELECSWNVIYQPGTLRAEGRDTNGITVCSHELHTAGNPYKIELSVEQPILKPDGTEFKIKANGSDCGFILAKIVDSNGYLCPTASNTITFSVTGEGKYLGGYNFYVYENKPLTYHAPGDFELDAEAGMIKIAVKSTFVPGIVTINATSPGLISGMTQFTTVSPITETDVPVKLLCRANPQIIACDTISISTITASICDTNNNLISTATAIVTFSLSGTAGGTLIGTNPVQTISGIASIIYRSGTSSGTVTVTATAESLIQGTVNITLIKNLPPNPPSNLKCNGEINPINLADFTPDLSWNFSDPDPDNTQSAYRVIVSSDITIIQSNIGNIYDTNKVFSQTNYITYNGVALIPKTTYYWKVMTWDNFNSSSPYSTAASFVTAENSPPNPPINLKCNGLINPVNLTDLTPELSWEFNDPNPGDSQTAYQLLVADEMNSMNNNIGNKWDTGKVNSTANIVIYNGSPLQPSGVYYFKVRTWDKSGAVSPYSTILSFIMSSNIPILSISTTTLDFGTLDAGQTATLTFDITNTGSGTLTGTIDTDQEWLTVDPPSFVIPAQAGIQTINVTVDNSVLNQKEGQYTGTITVTSNGGTETVSVIVTATCVLVKPNPYNPNKGLLTFFGDGIVPGETKIKIYTLSGELVKQLRPGTGKEIVWDGKTENGTPVTTGIYLYTYESPKEKGIGKFTVIVK